jgi:hypothetical protein
MQTSGWKSRPTAEKRGCGRAGKRKYGIPFGPVAGKYGNMASRILGFSIKKLNLQKEVYLGSFYLDNLTEDIFAKNYQHYFTSDYFPKYYFHQNYFLYYNFH